MVCAGGKQVLLWPLDLHSTCSPAARPSLHVCPLPILEAFHHPMAGLAWTAIAENPTLVDFFDVLTLSIDRGGRTYVSTMEAIDYPITATQWCAGGRF